MKKISEILFSFFNPGVHQTTPAKSVNITEVVEMIIGDTFKNITELLRIGKASKIKDLYSVTFSVLVSRRCKDGILEWTGFLVFDIDGLDFASTMKWRLSIDVFLKPVLIFISPRSRGLKIVIRVKDGTPEEHTLYFQAAASYIKNVFGIEADKGNDASRLCFLCWDPAAYFNSDGYVERDALLKLLPTAAPASAAAAATATIQTRQCLVSTGADNMTHTGAPTFSKPDYSTSERPSDLLNKIDAVYRRALKDLVDLDGWTLHPDGIHLTREGKKGGNSGIFNYYAEYGFPIFTNYSSSAKTFGVRGFSPIQIICRLEFQNDWNLTIKALSDEYL